MNFMHIVRNKQMFGWMAAGMIACSLVFSSPAFAAEAEDEAVVSDEGPEVPFDIYQWVQSTARQNYYFNRQQMHYEVKDGKINRDVLIVPTLRTYDDIQIEDVVAKRRWNMEPLDGYDHLVGAAEYLRIDRKAGTVTIERHDDLDDTWGTINKVTEPTTVTIADLSEKDVDGCFYRAILKYADKHAESLLKRTQHRFGGE